VFGFHGAPLLDRPGGGWYLEKFSLWSFVMDVADFSNGVKLL
jgi:hypothetical protein